jgi:hypothetical protein
VYLPLDPRFTGSNPAEAMDFKGDKNLQQPSFRGEVKLEVPHYKILWHVKITCKYKQKYFASLNSHSFHPFLVLATRCLLLGLPELWWMSQESSSVNYHSTVAFHTHISPGGMNSRPVGGHSSKT